VRPLPSPSFDDSTAIKNRTKPESSTNFSQNNHDGFSFDLKKQNDVDLIDIDSLSKKTQDRMLTVLKIGAGGDD